MDNPKPVKAASLAELAGKTNYPLPFAPLVQGRSKRKLGDAFGLRNFGVNLTTLQPAARSALHHAHSKQDEFVYVLEGWLTLVLGDEEFELEAGDCVGFPAGTGTAHHLVNRSGSAAAFLEVGDRTTGDSVVYPDDDIAAEMTPAGHWRFTHKDGTPW